MSHGRDQFAFHRGICVTTHTNGEVASSLIAAKEIAQLLVIPAVMRDLDEIVGTILIRQKIGKLLDAVIFGIPPEEQRDISEIDGGDQRIVVLVDPMLATGGSASDALTKLKETGCKQIKFMCLVAAPEGVAKVQADHPDVDIYTAAMDERLNEHD